MHENAHTYAKGKEEATRSPSAEFLDILLLLLYSFCYVLRHSPSPLFSFWKALWVCLVYEKCYTNKVALPCLLFLFSFCCVLRHSCLFSPLFLNIFRICRSPNQCQQRFCFSLLCIYCKPFVLGLRCFTAPHQSLSIICALKTKQLMILLDARNCCLIIA